MSSGQVSWARIALLVPVATIVTAVFAPGSGAMLGDHPNVASLTEALSEKLPMWIDELDVPGAGVALIVDGDPAWAGSFGVASVATGRPLTHESVFRAESISKSVTAWGIMSLVECGMIELDDRLLDHVDSWETNPDLREQLGVVTVRQLLSHTSGLSQGTIGVHYPPGPTVPTLRDDLDADVQMVGAPGKGFVYSNTGFNLLELLIEDVTGEPFADWMDREVLSPLGMSHSSFAWSDALGPIGDGHGPDGDTIPLYVYPAKGSGGLFSTVEDIARFVAAGSTRPGRADGAVLSRASIESMYRPSTEITGVFSAVAPTYGFGHFVETLPDGHRAVWHGGQGSGWMSHFHSVPETGDGIVILTNSQRSWPLIARISTEWSEWAGFGEPGMSNILLINTAATALIAVTWVCIVWQIGRLAIGLVRGSRRIAPGTPLRSARGFVQFGTGAGLLAWVTWSLLQTYRIETALLPQASGWLTFTAMVSAVVLLGSALTASSTRRSPDGHIEGIGARPQSADSDGELSSS